MKMYRFLGMWLLIGLGVLLAGCSSSDDDPVDSCQCSPSPVTETDGLVLVFEKQTVEKPSNISVLFKVETNDGKPVDGLVSGDFEISEDENLISEFESQQAIVPKPKAFTHHILLLLDLSGSVMQNDEKMAGLKSAAENFVAAVMPEPDSASSGEILMGISWFDGATDLHALVRFTEDAEILRGGIDTIDKDISEDLSTNLYGAVIKGIDTVQNAVRSSQKTVTSGSLVIFTDGEDQAARATEDQAVSKVLNADDDISVYTIGLGSEIDTAVLQDLGKDGFIRADDLDELVTRFEEVADTITADVNSYYLLEYCSPKRQGRHHLTIGVTHDGKSGSMTTCFCADGFEGGCEISGEN